MTQTRLGSLIEAVINLLIGLSINLVANMLILPAFGFASLTWSTNLWIGLVYTGISLVRQYALRRWFSSRLHFMSIRIAKEIKQ